MHKVGTKLQWEKTSSGDLTRGPHADLGLPKLPALAECNDRALPAPWTVGGASWKAHVQSAAFNFATAVLTARPGDSVGDMCEYPVAAGSATTLISGSRPAPARTQTASSPAHWSAASWSSIQTTIAHRLAAAAGREPRRAHLPAADGRVSSVTLPPRSAAVIKY